MAASVCVVGSINMDLVVRAPRFARPGETVLGETFDIHPGGKGANQAVAASRMGAQVSFVGCLGDDDWGSKLRGCLTSEGVDITKMRTLERVPTGVAIITVIPDGENAIVVAPGANARFSPEDVEQASSVIAAADVLILQAEISAETNARAIEIAKKANTAVLFNAAPAAGMPVELLRDVEALVVNREEASLLVGDEEHEVSPSGLARRLASFGPERVVVTMGAEGAIHFDGKDVTTFEAYPVSCVDTTGAGDAFVGALATLRGEGVRLVEAVRYASGAGALATCVGGAIPSLPTREAVETLLKGMHAKTAS